MGTWRNSSAGAAATQQETILHRAGDGCEEIPVTPALSGHVPELVQRVEETSRACGATEAGDEHGDALAVSGGLGGRDEAGDSGMPCDRAVEYTERLSAMGKQMELAASERRKKKGKYVILYGFSLINWIDIIF
uniref:Uncharacterized protein n=1 Tax=Oryza meridionalis TaxID=40149 RepID=A0A0E0E2D8_9ORYZ